MTESVRFEPDERPAPGVALGLGFQYALLAVAGIVLTPVIVVRAAGGSDDFLGWATFAALLISGLTTALQAIRLGRVGAGYILLMGTSGAFIAVSAAALRVGGPGLLGTLVAVSALFQFLLSARLSLFRRIFTPTVSGTVIMLIAVTVMPILFDMLTAVPEDAAPAAAPVSVVATLVVTIAVTLRASGIWRLWAPAVGIVAGSLVAAGFGLYDFQNVLDADWIGFPAGAWPGLDLGFGAGFWTLLPAFVLVTLIGAIETVGDGVAIQRVSWRKPRAIDFRAVQGAVAADGVGNLLSGLAATVPNTTYSTSVSVTEITGVAARTVGIWIGAVFVALAFLPKFLAVILAVPDPVIGAYAVVLISVLFVLGMKIVVQDGLDYKKGVIAGTAFWIGAGFQSGAIFGEHLGPAWNDLLGNGMTSGGLAAIALTLFLEWTRPRRRRLATALDVEAFPQIDEFLAKFAAGRGYGAAMTDRLRAVGEETLLTLTQQGTGERRLFLSARSDGAAAELEFVAATDDANIEDRMALLSDQAVGGRVEQEASLRLLRHFASSVRHQQYHDTDVVTVRVEPAEG